MGVGRRCQCKSCWTGVEMVFGDHSGSWTQKPCPATHPWSTVLGLFSKKQSLKKSFGCTQFIEECPGKKLVREWGKHDRQRNEPIRDVVSGKFLPWPVLWGLCNVNRITELSHLDAGGQGFIPLYPSVTGCLGWEWGWHLPKFSRWDGSSNSNCPKKVTGRSFRPSHLQKPGDGCTGWWGRLRQDSDNP